MTTCRDNLEYICGQWEKNQGASSLTIAVRAYLSEAAELALSEARAKPNSIPLTPAEIQSGLDRVRWAELLIRQLPDKHEGRNSWLLNYGIGSPPPEPNRQPIWTAPETTQHSFINEIGNRIKITIEGPTSVSENVLTPMEAKQLQTSLAIALFERDAPQAQAVKALGDACQLFEGFDDAAKIMITAKSSKGGSVKLDGPALTVGALRALTRPSTTEAKPVDPKLIENVAYICGQWEKNQGASSLTIAVRLLLAALDNDKEQSE